MGHNSWVKWVFSCILKSWHDMANAKIWMDYYEMRNNILKNPIVDVFGSVLVTNYYSNHITTGVTRVGPEEPRATEKPGKMKLNIRKHF